MARYAVSREGAESLMNLARVLLGSAKEIESAESALWNALQKESESFGAFEENLREITREIRQPLSTYREAFFAAARRLSRQADEILDVLNLTGPASAGYAPLSVEGSLSPSDAAQFQSYADAVISGELSPLVDFRLYQETAAAIDRELVGLTTKDGVAIKSKSKHFIARAIGSAEQKRNGVSLEDCKRALQSPTDIRRRGDSAAQYILKGICSVSVNPNTGNLIQTNPLSKESAEP